MADPLNSGPDHGRSSSPSILQQELSVILAPRYGLVICALVSATLLAGAFLFEHVGGMAPCSLCIWQRWAHLGVMAAAASGLLLIDLILGLFGSFLGSLGSCVGVYAGKFLGSPSSEGCGGRPGILSPSLENRSPDELA